MLDPYQKNALEVRMMLLEASLRSAITLIQDPPEGGLLTRVRPLPTGAGSRLERLFMAMLEELAAIVREFDLRPRDEEVGRLISADMAGAWSDMQEVLSGRLKRYGNVDPRLSSQLDPHLQRLIRMALEAGDLAREGGRSEAM